MSGPTTMRAWRTQKWGQPRDVLKLDTLDIPEPGPGELLVRNLAIPLNLNDMERVTGGNMMVTPELPLIPGMEVMGVVHACGAGVINRLNGLGHHSIICGHHENDNIGDLCPSRPHGRKGLMARGVEEGNLLSTGQCYAVGTDVLRDATRLAHGHFRGPDVIQK